MHENNKIFYVWIFDREWRISVEYYFSTEEKANEAIESIISHWVNPCSISTVERLLDVEVNEEDFKFL